MSLVTIYCRRWLSTVAFYDRVWWDWRSDGGGRDGWISKRCRNCHALCLISRRHRYRAGQRIGLGVLWQIRAAVVLRFRVQARHLILRLLPAENEKRKTFQLDFITRESSQDCFRFKNKWTLNDNKRFLSFFFSTRKSQNKLYQSAIQTSFMSQMPEKWLLNKL